MKTCPVCALDVQDTYLFCPDDGSSLGTFSGSSVNGPTSASKVVVETAEAVVLYCPACAAEYPLTFSECPMHGVKLTKHNISRPSIKQAATETESQLKQPESTISNQLTSLDLMRSHKERPGRMAEVANATSAIGFDYPRFSVDFSQEPRTESGYSEPLTEVEERGFERPGFRVAAIATVIALAVFALVAMYAFLSNLSRRPPAPPARVASVTEAAPQPFVPTPQEAQDYKEEPAPVALPTPEPRSDRPVSTSRTERSVRSVQSAAKAPGARPSETPNPMTKASTSPMPALPRGNSGGFDARLVRARSRKTPSGFRYDLTFNMQEQAGRSAQWQRVLVTTRSASGVNHSQAIPFAHRLGATGALTFTISVELTGRSDADWHGRVVCTTLGWDNKGAPLQASFGANLTP
ncbi:MAG: hypothetical protein AABN33_01855 [Acidobacteriota bacterium]